jgi:Flp pilus assembly protein TadG
MMVLFVLLFVVMWIFDLHKAIYIKSASRNAGDSAALMAARWQGLSLNLMGDLNIMHALALSSNDVDAASAITNMQARLCYVGPMIALMASQQAAKNNGVFPNADFDKVLKEHASTVRYQYPAETGPDGKMLFPEPYPNCWEEYAGMLELIAKDGVVAGPDNAHMYTDATGGHTLLRIDFYDAVAGRDWCWFFHYNQPPHLLETYENYASSWPPLPEPPHETYMNSEIFSLGLSKWVTELSALTDMDTVTTIAEERTMDASGLNSTGMTATAAWYVYGGGWSSWDTMTDLSFPLTGTLRPQYDYIGADAVIRIEVQAERLVPAAKNVTYVNKVTWTAAAKPFGYLTGDQKPNSVSLVLPAFHAVRLFPIDASTAPSGGAFNIAWRQHIEYHLPEYLKNGPQPDSTCYYCQQLLTWENPEFRQFGIAWLSSNSWQCTIAPIGGGGGHGGGTRRGH